VPTETEQVGACVTPTTVYIISMYTETYLALLVNLELVGELQELDDSAKEALLHGEGLVG
jgi:hypothetical protein